MQNELLNVMNDGQKKIKVAYVLGALNHGGLENLTLDICRNANEFECMCIYRNDGNLSSAFRDANIDMLHIPRKGSLLRYMWQLRKSINNQQIDILHSQTASNTLILGLCLIGCKKRIITTIHSFSFLNASELYKRFVLAVSEKILFVSNYQMNMYIQRCPSRLRKKCSVLYNGIDSTKFERKYDIPDIYQNAKGIIKLCVVGNIRKARTYEVIIEAMYRLRLEGINNIGLYIVGNTPKEEQYLLDYYKNLCNEYGIDDIVHFVGGRNDVPAILQHSDIYIMSSIETFGISIVEAMMSGVPVIVNDFDVMKEVTDNGKLAMLYKTNDATDLLDKLQLMIRNIDQYENQAADRTKFVRNTYSLTHCVNKLYNLYFVN